MRVEDLLRIPRIEGPAGHGEARAPGGSGFLLLPRSREEEAESWEGQLLPTDTCRTPGRADLNLSGPD